MNKEDIEKYKNLKEKIEKNCKNIFNKFQELYEKTRLSEYQLFKQGNEFFSADYLDYDSEVVTIDIKKGVLLDFDTYDIPFSLLLMSESELDDYINNIIKKLEIGIPKEIVKVKIYNDVAVFPGSFNPFHLGHKEVLRKALGLFDKVIVLVADNQEKPVASPEDRIASVKVLVSEFGDRVEVDYTSGMVHNYCRNRKIHHIIRGLRNIKDFEYEIPIADYNKSMENLETVFILADSELRNVSSSKIRQGNEKTI